MLDRLAEMGMDIAEALHGRILTLAAAAPAQPAGAPADAAASELSLAFQRAARTVRQCLALKPKLIEEWRRGAEKERALAILAARRERRKAEVRQAVEQAISERPETPNDRAHDRGISERLFADLYDRLDSPDIGDELGRDTVGAIAAGICRDLGVPPVWDSWQTQPWFEAEGWDQSEEDAEEEEPEAAPCTPKPCTPKPSAQECEAEAIRYLEREFPLGLPSGYVPWARMLLSLARERDAPS